VPPWKGATSHRSGEIICGTHVRGVGCIYIATSEGVTGTSEPDWGSAGTSITDGTVKWQRSDHQVVEGSADVTACTLTMGRVSADYIDRCVLSRTDWSASPAMADGGHNKVWLNGHRNDSRGLVAKS
jgi:hypothetical protein